jgi:hypothetical protein
MKKNYHLVLIGYRKNVKKKSGEILRLYEVAQKFSKICLNRCENCPHRIKSHRPVTRTWKPWSTSSTFS